MRQTARQSSVGRLPGKQHHENTGAEVEYHTRIMQYLGDLRTTTSPEARLDKALGAVYGLAVGNICGIEIEGWPHIELAVVFPDGMPSPEPEESQRPMDDDLEACVQNKRVPGNGFPVQRINAVVVGGALLGGAAADGPAVGRGAAQREFQRAKALGRLW